MQSTNSDRSKKFYPLTEGMADRMPRGTILYHDVNGTLESGRFNYYMPDGDRVYFMGNPNQVPRTQVYTTSCFPVEHLPKEYIVFDTQEFLQKALDNGDRAALEHLMPNLCTHCGPRANCAKCPVHQVMEMMQNAYNRCMDGVASSMGGYWIDDDMPERPKFNRNVPEISAETKAELIEVTCTYCPARKFNYHEFLANDLDEANDIGGEHPGEKCLKCPLYKKCVLNNS